MACTGAPCCNTTSGLFGAAGSQIHTVPSLLPLMGSPEGRSAAALTVSVWWRSVFDSFNSSMDHSLTVPWLQPEMMSSSSNATAVTRPGAPQSMHGTKAQHSTQQPEGRSTMSKLGSKDGEADYTWLTSQCCLLLTQQHIVLGQGNLVKGTV